MAKPFSPEQTILVVGAGHAGVAMADQLRKNGFKGTLTLVDRESTPPAERPPLSKGFHRPRADGDAGELLRQPGWYGDSKIDLRAGVEVTEIDTGARVARCADGTGIGWDGLVLAPGAVPRPLPVPGGDHDLVHLLRVPADSERISARLGTAGRLAVVGGGYIGLEVAASVRRAGLEVTVIETAPRLLARVASPEVSAYFNDLHRGEGVTVMTGAGVTAIEPDGPGVKLVAGDGAIAADLVVVGIGVVPDLTLAEAAGLATGDGILVDARYRTSLDNVYAIGDAALPDGGRTGGAARIESVHHAQMSAAIAAAAMMGKPPGAHEVPWFWSDQFDVKLQSAGIVPDGAETAVRRGRREGALSFWSFKDGTLRAVEAVNDPQAYMAGRTVIERGMPLDSGQAADGGFDLKALLRK